MTKNECDSLKRGDKVSYKGQIITYLGSTEIKSTLFEMFDIGDKDSSFFFYRSEVVTDDFQKL